MFYKNYEASSYYPGYCCLVSRLSQKGKDEGALDKEDLLAILNWGGNAFRLEAKFQSNKPDDVRRRTKEAYCSSVGEPLTDGDAKSAYEELMKLEGWGPTYASKTLMFMLPDRYVALDDRMRKRLQPLVGSSTVTAYLEFRKLCCVIQRQGVGLPPDHSRYPSFPKDPQGQWLLADIQQSVFQCIREGTSITPCFHPDGRASARTT